ncbi:AraC-like DNA-binding protein [Saonia flava]|uniref:AraC-like DNA-binding protein n=1 Tax=Saonia flava TaxID=523696 RepID=A0A846R0I8_9FLAO|nr:helix-turn-helix domain-containing protein [Saonia flava]NJB70884.1 AraC-like DNA-binding protein [Saonia flava]
MNITAIFNFLLIAGAVQGFLFNIGTFLSRKKIEKPVLFLNLFVLFISLNNLQSWLVDKKFLDVNFFWENFTVPWYILIVPMFYAFLVFYLGIEEKRLSFIKFSLLFFTLALMVRISLIFLAQNEAMSTFTMRTYNLVEDAIALSYSIFLYIKSIRLMFNYQQLYPDVLKFDDLKWIKLFLKLGGVVFLFWGFAVLVNSFSEVSNPPYSYYPLRLSSSALIYWVGYQAFFHYILMKDRIALRKDLGIYYVYKKPDVVTDASKRLEREQESFEKVDQYVLSNKKYLDPYLSMEKLAEELDMGSSSLSKLVNGYSGHNFSDYINKLRVDNAKEILLDLNFSHYTILSIGLECGFNSKSTFYTAFKKFTGETPTSFRK